MNYVIPSILLSMEGTNTECMVYKVKDYLILDRGPISLVSTAFCPKSPALPVFLAFYARFLGFLKYDKVYPHCAYTRIAAISACVPIILIARLRWYARKLKPNSAVALSLPLIDNGYHRTTS